ncbi:MAG: cyclic di-GMP-binding protein FimX [Gammaproteobacteria bacterium]
MVDEQEIVRLLIVEESLNEAETYVSTLRGAGYALRAKQVKSPDELQAAISQRQQDLILCATPLPHFPIEEAIAVVARNDKDIPLVAVVDRATQESLVAAMRAGARDAIPKGQNEHLKLVVDRELGDLRIRRCLRETEQRHHEAERRNRALLDTARDAITYVTDGMHIRANEAYLELFGFADPEEIEGMPLMDMIAPEDHATVKQFLRKLPELRTGSESLEVSGRRLDGETFPLRMVFSPAVIEGEECFQIIIPSDEPAGEQSNRELEDQIEILSNRDLLTGLYNRQYFIEQLEHQVAEILHGGSQHALLLIAIDKFDDVIDRVGIASSDLLVVDIAELLRGALSEDLVLARFSDQLFALLIPCPQPSDAEELADQLRKKIEEHVSEVNGQALNPTASIGITLVSENAASAQEVLRRAHQCCDEARSAGGNRVKIFTPPALDQALESSADILAKVVANALEQDAFSLLFQPISSLRGEQHEFYEAFIQLADENGNAIPTKQFIAAAERSGLMPRIDQWVADRAIERLAKEHAGGKKVYFFLNISEKTLASDEYLPWLAGRLKEARVSGEYVIIEVKEPAASSNLQGLKLLIKGLNALRSRLALAQFGSGLNSLNFLKHVPASFVKIDRALMANLPANPESQQAVKEITTTAHQLDMEVIAEFVEDANSLPVLWQCEVDYIQGYFLQEPSTELSFDFSGESF